VALMEKIDNVSICTYGGMDSYVFVGLCVSEQLIMWLKTYYLNNGLDFKCKIK
jgi:hypothetical protein